MKRNEQTTSTELSEDNDSIITNNQCIVQ